MNVITIVNYNNIEVTSKAIFNIESKIGDIDSLVIYVVDNSDDKSQCKNLERNIYFDNVVFLYPNDNLGYMRGGSYAYEYHKKKFNSDINVFILMNNDVEIINNNLFDELLKYNDDDLMLISPKLLMDGINVNPYMQFRKSNRYMRIWSFVLTSYYLSRLFFFAISLKRKSKMSLDRAVLSTYDIYGTHGAVFILTHNFFRLGGRIDELPFLYGEEIYISEQIRALGGKCKYNDKIVFSHIGSATLGSKLSYFKYSCIKNAHKFLVRKYYR
ncbi:TPA: glycosyltransferase family 2 protein [Vibrio vulnificus]|nr:glycosyltransferase family 2 protein [Vibrio vulnificus]